MKNKLLLSVLFTLLILTNPLKTNAQENTNQEEHFKYGIGAGAGFATGYGLSFRYIPKKFGAQVNFAPYKKDETERYSLGLTFLYNLIESRYTNFFIYQANHYYYNSEMVSVYQPNPPYNHEFVRQTESYFNNGLGFGIEVIIAKRIGLNLMSGYAFYDNFRQINVTGELALYYKF